MTPVEPPEGGLGSVPSERVVDAEVAKAAEVAAAAMGPSSGGS